jgi:hypothetical protein
MITPKDVEVALQEIQAVAADDEVAHSKRDDLWWRVLTAIASGAPEPGLLAAIALRTEKIEFVRWDA